MKKGFLLLGLILLASIIYAQHNQRRTKTFNKATSQADIFLQKQWWLGFKAGPNLSKAVPETSHHVISPVNYEAAAIRKHYKDFHKVGTHVTFEIAFHFKAISISFQPTYRTNRFTYTNEYEWLDRENAENRLVLNYEQDQKVSYLDWPLMARYGFQVSALRPYAQFGLYSAMLLDASKSVVISGSDYASGGVNEFKNEPIIIGARDLFAKYHWGILAGVGLHYNMGNVRLNLDATWKLGMSNIAETENRYGSDRLSGVGDSLDDMKLNHFGLSAGCLFPLRFLGSGFKSVVYN